MKYDYYKYHALGNDYIIIDPNNVNFKLNKDLIKLICHRNYGIGSDGILFGPIFNDKNEIYFKIFNPDGSEAEKSGNGIREFAKYLFDEKYINEKFFKLHTLGGPVNIEYLNNNATLIKVDMGKVTFDSKLIPTKFSTKEAINCSLEINNNIYNVSCVSIGNPHCVILMDKVSSQIAQSLGPMIENNKMFPNKINVQFLQILDKNNIKIEIWERGAGYTLASGTSSCAAASVAYKLGLTDNDINVHMPGGNINIHINNDWSVNLIGNVTSVSYGNFSKEFFLQKINL